VATAGDSLDNPSAPSSGLGAVWSTEVVVSFIDSVKERFGVEPVCHVLSQFVGTIAPSTYYAFKTRPRSARSRRDEQVAAVVEEVFFDQTKGRGLAGARKVWKQLHREGVLVEGTPVARCTVERIMRQRGLRGAHRGGDSFYVTTRADRHADPAARPPDLVNRDFTAAAPNRLWVVDFTYIDTASGMVFTAFVQDVFSRRIVGWATSDQHATELPLAALEMALWTRGRTGQDITGLVHHSDAGSEYTAITYRKNLADAGALASIGTVGDSYDNAMAESIIGLYKTECIKKDGPWVGVEDVELATSEWVHWYNTHRLHSSIGYLPPIEYEATHFQRLTVDGHHRDINSHEPQHVG
jgi:putative transposase